MCQLLLNEYDNDDDDGDDDDHDMNSLSTLL